LTQIIAIISHIDSMLSMHLYGFLLTTLCEWASFHPNKDGKLREMTYTVKRFLIC